MILMWSITLLVLTISLVTRANAEVINGYKEIFEKNNQTTIHLVTMPILTEINNNTYLIEDNKSLYLNELKDIWIRYLEKDENFNLTVENVNETIATLLMGFNGNPLDYPEECVVKDLTLNDEEFKCQFKLQFKEEGYDIKIDYKYEMKNGIITANNNKFSYNGNPIGKSFKLGGNSTTVHFQSNVEDLILEDADVSQWADQDGERGQYAGLNLDDENSVDWDILIKYNITCPDVIPCGKHIDEVIFSMFQYASYLDTGEWIGIELFHVYNNFTVHGGDWDEGNGTTWETATGSELNWDDLPTSGYFNPVPIFTVQYDDGVNDSSGDKNWTLTNAFSWDYNNSNDNSTVWFNANESLSNMGYDYMAYRPHDYGVPYEMHLWITYSDLPTGCTPELQNDTWTYEGYNGTSINHANISCNESDLLTLNWTNYYWNWTTELDFAGCNANNTIYYDNTTQFNYTYESCDFCLPSMENITLDNHSHSYENNSCNESDLITFNWTWIYPILEWDSLQCVPDNIANYTHNLTGSNTTYESCDYCTPIMENISLANHSFNYVNNTCNATGFLSQNWSWTYPILEWDSLQCVPDNIANYTHNLTGTNITYNIECAINCTPDLQNDTWTYEGNVSIESYNYTECNSSNITTVKYDWIEWNWTTELDFAGCQANNTIYEINISWYNYTYVNCTYIPPAPVTECSYSVAKKNQWGFFRGWIIILGDDCLGI